MYYRFFSLSLQVHGNELIAIDTNKPRIPKIPIKKSDTVTVIKSKKILLLQEPEMK